MRRLINMGLIVTKGFQAEKSVVWKVLLLATTGLMSSYAPVLAQVKTDTKPIVSVKAPSAGQKTASPNTKTAEKIPAEIKAAPVPEPPKTPLLLALNPHFGESVTSEKQGPVAIVTTPTLKSSPNNNSEELPGAQFLPLVKQTYNPADPLNKGSFIDKHEFGIQLRSPF